MKAEWKVFIRGVEGRGKEVIKMLENLGGKIEGDGHIKDNKYLIADNEYIIFTIDHNGYISGVNIQSELAKIIMDNYREIILPGPWEDGDILINKGGTEYTIFKSYSYGTIFYTYSFSIRIDKEDIIRYRSCDGENLYENEDFRLATSEEVEQFHNILHKYHKEWNAEKKQLVDWKWKPKKGEKCWLVDYYGDINSLTWNDGFVEKKILDFGNYFQTQEEAEFAAEKIKKLLNAKS